MRGRILFVVGLGVGYVIGTRRGREGYVQLRDRAQSLWNSPQVQKTVETTKSVAKDKAPVLTEKVSEAVDTAKAVAEDVKTAGE